MRVRAWFEQRTQEEDGLIYALGELALALMFLTAEPPDATPDPSPPWWRFWERWG